MENGDDMIMMALFSSVDAPMLLLQLSTFITATRLLLQYQHRRAQADVLTWNLKGFSFTSRIDI